MLVLCCEMRQIFKMRSGLLNMPNQLRANFINMFYLFMIHPALKHRSVVFHLFKIIDNSPQILWVYMKSGSSPTSRTLEPMSWALKLWNQCPELWNCPTCPLGYLKHYSDYLKKKKTQNRNNQLLAYRKEIFCFWEFATSSQAKRLW